MGRFPNDTKKGKMRIKLVRGCICDSLTVDGKDEYSMNDDERRDVLKKIFERLAPGDLNYVLQALVKEMGEYDCDDEPCECCGDTVEWYVWDSPAKVPQKKVSDND